jgi:transcription termination factor Rho
MKMNKKVIGLIVAGTIVVTNCISISCVNSSYKNEINNYKKSEEQYQTEILNLKNDIIELKNKEENKYREFSSPNEVELGAGYFTVGKDVKEGIYDIVHIEGQGLVGINDEEWYQIGTDKEYGDAEEVKNVKLKEGDKIEVTSGLTFRFIPVEE